MNSTCPRQQDGRIAHYFKWDKVLTLWICQDCGAAITQAEAVRPKDRKDYRYVDLSAHTH